MSTFRSRPLQLFSSQGFFCLSLGLLLAGCSHTQPPVSPAVSSNMPPAYDYPFTSPYVATVVGTPPQQRVKFAEAKTPTERDIVIFPDRKRPEGFWYEDKLHYGELLQDHPAPVIYVIAGTGAAYNSKQMVTLANTFYASGMHVILLSSPTTSNFIVTASSNFLPGNAENDAQDLYRVIRRINQRLLRHDTPITQTYLAGYSLGGWNAGFVAHAASVKAANNEPAVTFDKVLLINPPLSVYRSIQKIDQMLYRSLPQGINGLDAFLNQILGTLAATGGSDALDFQDEAALTNVLFKLKPDDDRLATAIGLSFRLSSSNLIFTSDVMGNFGYIYPKNKPFRSTTPLNDYLAVALRTSLINYFKDVYSDHYTRANNISPEQLIESNSLNAIGPWLSSQSNIGMITNADDVILDSGDLNHLEQLFAGRSKIFPTGGHLGNLDHPAVINYIAQYFRGTAVPNRVTTIVSPTVPPTSAPQANDDEPQNVQGPFAPQTMPAPAGTEPTGNAGPQPLNNMLQQ